MATIISNGTTNLSTVNGFYRVEAENLGAFHATELFLSTARTIPLTFANVGDCQGVVLEFLSTYNIDREVVVTLQENLAGTWTDVAGATVTLTTADITGTANTESRNVGQYTVPCIIGTPKTITTAANVWRWDVRHGAGTGTWSLRTSNASAAFHATWCDNQVSFNNDDVLIVKDKVYIDQTATLGAVLGTGEAARAVSAVICSNASAPEVDTVCLLEWARNPAAAYTLSVKGQILLGGFGGMRIGREDRTLTPVEITIASPGVVTSVGHELLNGDRIKFSTTGALPTGLTAGTTYFVVNKTADTFEVEATVGGGAINTSDVQSGVHTCTHIRRIPIAQKATIDFLAPSPGTQRTGFCIPTATASRVYGARSSLFFYGEIPKYMATTLKQDAAIAQPNIVCTDNVDWVAGDIIIIGKSDIAGQGVLATHTIHSVAGDTITFTTNLHTSRRIAGGTVIKQNSSGILLQNHSTYSDHNVRNLGNLVLSGVNCYNQMFITSGANYYFYHTHTKEGALVQQSLTDCTCWTVNTAASYVIQSIVPPAGILMERCYLWRQNFGTGNEALYTTGATAHKSGKFEIKNSSMVGQYGSTISVSTRIRLTIENVKFENARASVPFYYMTGINSIFKNNSHWGSATVYTSGGAVYVGSCVNPLEISGNSYDKNVAALNIMAFTTIGCRDYNSTFGTESANTVDLAVGWSGANPDYVFISNTGNLVLNETYVPDMVVGGRIGFSEFNDTASDDRSIYTYGKIQRDLVTVKTAGGSSFRFEPTDPSEKFEFSFDIPTGDIQNKTMAIAVWCKLNNTAYYAGAHEMPRMTINYDGDKTTYAELAKNTDWQLLSCIFTPTTKAGKVIVTFSGATDATGTDRFFYWDDISVLYPAGFKLDLGGLDIWDFGLPVLPPIATVMGAKDVWAVETSALTGDGTVGKHISKKLLTLPQFIGLK